MTTTIRVAVDFTNIESTDDGNTTHYGGSFKLDGQEFRGYGDDRGDNHVWDTIDYVTAKCAEAWPGEEVDSDDILDAIPDSGFIVVTFDNGAFTVTAEA